MKIILNTFILCIALFLVSCQSSLQKEYFWTQKSISTGQGETSVEKLYEGQNQLYTYVDGPVIGIHHRFSNGDNKLFSIRDGSGSYPDGARVEVTPRLKEEVTFCDLDTDGDIDLIIFGEQYFGRFKDNKFAPFAASALSDRDPISFLSKQTSEQITAPNQSTHSITASGGSE